MSQDLKNKAIVIRDEKIEGANTATRVGTWMVDASSLIEEIPQKADTINEQGTVARRKQNGFVLNPSLISKFDVEIDTAGNVGFYRTTRLGYGIIESDCNMHAYYHSDQHGWVRNGFDWKGDDLLNLDKLNKSTIYIMPTLYNVESDQNGNVSVYYKSCFLNLENSTSTVSDKLSDCFTQEVSIVQGDHHYGFPGMCATKDGTLHSFYRKAAYHTGIDGSIMYSYSKDFGKTWSEEKVFFKGGTETEGTYQDYRDSKAIRMSNGKVLLSLFSGNARENGGVPPHHVDYDLTKYKAFAVIFEQKSDGTLNIDTQHSVLLPNIDGLSFMATAGGLVEHNNIIYISVYGGQPNDSYLLRSLDFGLTWEKVGAIQKGYNENSIAFLGDTMYCILRAVTGNSRIVKSNDLGKTWVLVKDLDINFNGMYMLSLGDTIMISGRAYSGGVTNVFMNNMGNFVQNNIQFPVSGDSGYADICTFENYVHIIYHSQLTNTSWGIFTRKIERNKVLGLSY